MYAVVGTNVCILSEKTKFQVNFFNIFPKSTLNTLGVIFACPLRPVSGGGQSVWGVCKNCTPGIRVSAMPVSGCLQCRHPGPAAGSGIRARDVRNGWFLLSVAGNACCPGSRPPPCRVSRSLAPPVARQSCLGRSPGSRALAAGAARYPARRCRVRQVRQKCIP